MYLHEICECNSKRGGAKMFWPDREKSHTCLVTGYSKADSPMEYKMDHKRRGNALIFNQKNFQSNSNTRYGTDKDRDNLKRSFLDLGFNVNVYNDKHKKNVLQELHKAAEMDHTDADCFVCIFLTHGEEGQISAHDDMIKIKEITDLFRGDQCKSLVGKPKIFIFQESFLMMRMIMRWRKQLTSTPSQQGQISSCVTLQQWDSIPFAIRNQDHTVFRTYVKHCKSMAQPWRSLSS
ncbi:caspase-6-like isoform X2 [Tachysurus fulvidraco]|uniref:caspase-6-like isoform X2 n=1 Tax=Tachysurus fulvidraco TaxID=1234273 RepID=UPI001FED5BE2|nr:caspase-6-like isoform X2 [Tachysurus fulvidraco]